jgi:hypothetical protein
MSKVLETISALIVISDDSDRRQVSEQETYFDIDASVLFRTLRGDAANA